MAQVPATTESESSYGIDIRGMAPGLAIMFNEPLYNRCIEIAKIMAKAQGITPPHLLQKSEACFAVVTRSITWKLDPFAVAQSTYDVGGKVGYEGKLVQAILENSGQVEGNVKYELFGDWNRIRGKFQKTVGDKGKMVFKASWKDEDEIGLGVWVRAKVKGEEELRELEFFLNSAWPRNSLLWATRPDQQIKYAACRAFANTVAPGLFMGVPFSGDDSMDMVDVTPARPKREDFAAQVSFNKSEPDAEDAGADTTPHDAETGEIAADEPADFGPPEAMEIGRKARDKGLPRVSYDRNYTEPLREAYLVGYDERDKEIEAGKAA